MLTYLAVLRVRICIVHAQHDDECRPRWVSQLQGLSAAARSGRRVLREHRSGCAKIGATSRLPQRGGTHDPPCLSRHQRSAPLEAVLRCGPPIVGITPLSEDETGLGYASGQFHFSVQVPIDGRPATVGNGSHVAFAAENRAMVDRFHATALAHGGTSDGPPGLRPAYDANYYGRSCGTRTATRSRPSPTRPADASDLGSTINPSASSGHSPGRGRTSPAGGRDPRKRESPPPPAPGR